MVGTDMQEVQKEEVQTRIDFLFKMVAIGPDYVGKTAALQRFVSDTFTPSYMATIGVDFYSKNLRTLNGEYIRLQIWDTAGQERFRVISRTYYRGADGVMLMFDVGNKSMFNAMTEWVQDVREKTVADCSLMLVGTKVDLEDKRQVPYEEAKAFATSHNMSYIEISAMTGHEVSQAFQLLVEQMMKSKGGEEKKPTMSTMPMALVDKPSQTPGKVDKAKHPKAKTRSKTCTII